MTRYLFDTDILSFLSDKSSEYHLRCVERLSRLSDEDELCVSLLTIYEMDYSIAAAGTDELEMTLRGNRQDLLENYQLLNLSVTAGQIYGRMKAGLKHRTNAKPRAMRGLTVDTILAATALEHRAILVSNDQIFRTIKEVEPSLMVETWAREEY